MNALTCQIPLDCSRLIEGDGVKLESRRSTEAARVRDHDKQILKRFHERVSPILERTKESASRPADFPLFNS